MTDPATIAKGLTREQRRALLWLWQDGSERSCFGVACGDPHYSTVRSLERRGLVRCRGGDGWTLRVAATELGLAWRAQLRNTETGGE